MSFCKVWSVNTTKKIKRNESIESNREWNQILRKYVKNDCLKDDPIPISDTFYFDQQSITFVYYPIHEIAPYSCGIIHITVPFSAIGKYLKPEFIKKYLKHMIITGD